MMKKKVSEKHVKIQTTLRPDILKLLDVYSNEMGMTRSGLITFMVQMIQAMDKNKSFKSLLQSGIETGIKASMKK